MRTKQAPIHSGYGERTTAREAVGNHDLSGAIAIVTGGHAGIGIETTRALTDAGATVVVGARRVDAARAALAGIRRTEVDWLDLFDPARKAEARNVQLARHAVGNKLELLVQHEQLRVGDRVQVNQLQIEHWKQ